MALDEPTKDDDIIEADGVTWLVAKEDRRDILTDNGLVVDYIKGWGGTGFTVSRRGYGRMGC
jgi:hypothetical protein